MKFVTGDDTGIIKWVKVESQKVERLPGIRRLGDAVENLCWIGPEGARDSRLCVGYASGLVEARHPDNGNVLGIFRGAPSIKCLQTYLGRHVLVVSEDGRAFVLDEWCAEEFPGAKFPEEEEEAAAAGDAKPAGDPKPAKDAAEQAKEDADKGIRRFQLLAPVKSAQLEPKEGSHRVAFGGGENDVRIHDIEKGEVTWKAKSMPHDWLQLKIPVRLTSVRWLTGAAPERSLLMVGTTDGKMRAYDASMQRRTLFENKISHMGPKDTGGYTGVDDDLPRPVKCAVVAKNHNGDWGYFMGNNMGALREYSLKVVAKAKEAPIRPGKKRHWDYAHKMLPMKRKYKDMMGGLRGLDVHPNGEHIVAVGLGRFAFLYHTRRNHMVKKVYLKQKLCSVLFAEEAMKEPKSEEDDAEGEEEEPWVDPEDADGVQEGFSDDDAECGESEAGEAGETGEAVGDGDAAANDPNSDAKADADKVEAEADEDDDEDTSEEAEWPAAPTEKVKGKVAKGPGKKKAKRPRKAVAGAKAGSKEASGKKGVKRVGAGAKKGGAKKKASAAAGGARKRARKASSV